MIAYTPGKLVLSGAYAVLEGAPAIVAAVDRYVVADSSRAADLVTAEVQEAIREGVLKNAPWFDASALRVDATGGASRKLGLGSSAAILVASLGTALIHQHDDDSALRDAVLPIALRCHRRAQHGGSGIDVAASTFGGILRCRMAPDGSLASHPHALPHDVVIEVYASPTSQNTRALLRAVNSFKDEQPKEYEAIFQKLSAAAEDAATARRVDEFVGSLVKQGQLLQQLGDAACVPIVDMRAAQLARIAEAEGAAFLPSGAGGVDISIWVGPRPSEAMREAAERIGFRTLKVRIGVEGLRRRAP